MVGFIGGSNFGRGRVGTERGRRRCRSRRNSGGGIMMSSRNPLTEEKPLEALAKITSSGLVDMSDVNRLNVLGMRAIADTMASTVLYEAGSSLYCCSCFVTQLQLFLGEQVCQLCAGAALGVWTVATTLGSMIHQERVKEEKIQTAVSNEAKDIAQEWNDYINSVDGMLDLSPVVYGNATANLEDAEEVEVAMTWLSSLDEVEGMGARRFMEKLVTHPDPRLRLQLVKSITELCVPSNGVVSLLQNLRMDGDREVSEEARSALQMLVEQKLISSEAMAKQPSMLDMSLDEARTTLSRIMMDSNLETAWGVVKKGGLNALRSGMDKVEERTSPLYKIGHSELHLLFSCSMFLLVFNLGHVFHYYETPVRFFGLGWVLSVAGLAVYPQSELAFHALQSAWEKPFGEKNA